MSDTELPDTESMDVDNLVSALWIRLIKHKQFPEAILASLLEYSIARDLENEESKDRAVWKMVTAANELQKQLRGEDTPVGAKAMACSFCSKTEPEVRLVAGPNVFICNECVVLVTEILAHEKSKTPPRTDGAD